MKYIYIILILSSLFIGCGYKADPVYVDDSKKIKWENDDL